MRRLDIAGERYDRLLVLSFAEMRKGNSFWTCRCDCGTVRVISAESLRSGGARSCGCYSRDRIAVLRKTHGASNTPEYKAWSGMRKRCSATTSQDFKNYGGRGIAICKRWDNFAAFLADMGPRPSPKHSIERIDNDGNYTPENCRWATRADQSRNRRHCIYLEDDGQRVTVAEYARKRGINPFNLYSRIRKWGSLERALSQPFRRSPALKSREQPINTDAQSHKKSA